MKFRSRLDMKEAVMTDPQNYDWRNYEYLRRGEALGSAAWGWIIGVTVALVGFLLIASYSKPGF